MAGLRAAQPTKTPRTASPLAWVMTVASAGRVPQGGKLYAILHAVRRLVRDLFTEGHGTSGNGTALRERQQISPPTLHRPSQSDQEILEAFEKLLHELGSGHALC